MHLVHVYRLSTNVPERSLCDASETLNHTEVNSRGMLVLRSDTKVQCFGRAASAGNRSRKTAARVSTAPVRRSIIPASALRRHAGSSYKATRSGRSACIGSSEHKFLIAEASWLIVAPNTAARAPIALCRRATVSSCPAHCCCDRTSFLTKGHPLSQTLKRGCALAPACTR